MRARSWAHQELSRKRIKQYAAALSGEEIRADIESLGEEPVFVGVDVERRSVIMDLG
jgi:hypothetical protein